MTMHLKMEETRGWIGTQSQRRELCGPCSRATKINITLFDNIVFV